MSQLFTTRFTTALEATPEKVEYSTAHTLNGVVVLRIRIYAIGLRLLAHTELNGGRPAAAPFELVGDNQRETGRIRSRWRPAVQCSPIVLVFKISRRITIQYTVVYGAQSIISSRLD